MFTSDFNLAQDLYLASSCPVAALEVWQQMRGGICEEVSPFLEFRSLCAKHHVPPSFSNSDFRFKNPCAFIHWRHFFPPRPVEPEEPWLWQRYQIT